MTEFLLGGKGIIGPIIFNEVRDVSCEVGDLFFPERLAYILNSTKRKRESLHKICVSRRHVNIGHFCRPYSLAQWPPR
jgi:hypothetical protein